MAWSDVTGATTYTGWKTYEEKLDFTGTSAQTIYSSALASFQGNVVLPAAIISSTLPSFPPWGERWLGKM